MELYKWGKYRQVHEIHEIVELEKWHVSMVENSRKLDAHHIIEVSLLLCNGHIVPKDYDRAIFYVNKYIDQDQFN